MLKQWIKYGAIGLGFVAIIMAVTNPAKDAYLEYATLKMADDVKDGLCNKKGLSDVIGSVGDLISGICRTGIDTQRSRIRELISSGSRRQNLIFFSIYRTDVFDQRYTTVAICGNFITSKTKIKNT